MTVDDSLIGWGRECGMPIPEGISASRLPSLVEIRKAVAELEGFYTEESPGLREKDIDIKVKSYEEKEFTLEHDPVMGEYYGKKVFKSPIRDTTLWINISDDDQITAISFHKGDEKLAVQITHRFTKYCGPLALIADCSGIPLFIVPDKFPPDGLDVWD
jgi:hypothetical protein